MHAVELLSRKENLAGICISRNRVRKKIYGAVMLGERVKRNYSSPVSSPVKDIAQC